jgi:hypothetical protein
MMNPTPTRQIHTPMISDASGFTPSTSQPQKMERMINTPPSGIAEIPVNLGH